MNRLSDGGVSVVEGSPLLGKQLGQLLYNTRHYLGITRTRKYNRIGEIYDSVGEAN